MPPPSDFFCSKCRNRAGSKLNDCKQLLNSRRIREAWEGKHDPVTARSWRAERAPALLALVGNSLDWMRCQVMKNRSDSHLSAMG